MRKAPLRRLAATRRSGRGDCVSFFNAEYGDQELEARAKMVCLYLHDRANKDGESWYAIDKHCPGIYICPAPQ